MQNRVNERKAGDSRQEEGTQLAVSYCFIQDLRMEEAWLLVAKTWSLGKAHIYGYLQHPAVI